MEVYLVGGAVRDELLGLPVQERDWVVVGSTAQQLLDSGYHPVGKDFPVFLHPKTHEEYALARTESKSGRGHKGFIVNADINVSLEEDLQRRDLTINAIARDQDGNLVDFVGGVSDLHAKKLTHVSTAFSDDPLRVLRVARFFARFNHLGFEVSSDTMALMADMISAGNLQELTPERVFKELEKALNTASPWKFFELLQDINGLEAIGFKNVPIDLVKFRHACDVNDDAVIRFAMLLASANITSVKRLSEYLKTPKRYLESALLTVTHYNTWRSVDKLAAEEIVEFFYQLDAYRRPERLEVMQACGATLFRSSGDSAGHITQLWSKCLDETRKISVRDLHSIPQKNEIGQAIRALRIQTILSL